MTAKVELETVSILDAHPTGPRQLVGGRTFRILFLNKKRHSFTEPFVSSDICRVLYKNLNVARVAKL